MYFYLWIVAFENQSTFTYFEAVLCFTILNLYKYSPSPHPPIVFSH